MSERFIILRDWEAAGLAAGRISLLVRAINPQPENPETFGVSPVWGWGTPCFMDGKPIPENKRRFCVHAAFNEGGKRLMSTCAAGLVRA